MPAASQAGPRNVSSPKNRLMSLRAESNVICLRSAQTLPASSEMPAYIGTFRKPSPPRPTLRKYTRRPIAKFGPSRESGAAPDKFKNPPKGNKLRSSEKSECSKVPAVPHASAVFFPQECAMRRSTLAASVTRSSAGPETCPRHSSLADLPRCGKAALSKLSKL
jgi:hypothetical protein